MSEAGAEVTVAPWIADSRLPARMKALSKLEPAPGLALAEVPVPSPGPGDLLIRVSAAGICGTDLHIYRWDPWARARLRLPRVLGHEFCGTVIEIGVEVRSVAVGDRVAGESHVTCGRCRRCQGGEAHICESVEIIGVDRDGAFAEYAVVPARSAWRLAPQVPDETGAIMDPLGNAVHTALATELAGRSVLITGCGPIGLMAIPVCRMAGAATVIASDVRTGRLDLARRLGADLAVDAGQGGAPNHIRDYTGGEGVDVVLEMSGHPSAIRDGLDSVRPGGWVGLLGLPASPVELDLSGQVIFKAVRLEGIFGRRLWKTWEQMAAFLRRGLDVGPVITHRLPLDRFEEAFGALEAGDAGKVVFTIGS